jgi:hypothetical protein
VLLQHDTIAPTPTTQNCGSATEKINREERIQSLQQSHRVMHDDCLRTSAACTLVLPSFKAQTAQATTASPAQSEQPPPTTALYAAQLLVLQCMRTSATARCCKAALIARCLASRVTNAPPIGGVMPTSLNTHNLTNAHSPRSKYTSQTRFCCCTCLLLGTAATSQCMHVLHLTGTTEQPRYTTCMGHMATHCTHMHRSGSALHAWQRHNPNVRQAHATANCAPLLTVFCSLAVLGCCQRQRCVHVHNAWLNQPCDATARMLH